jgi:nitroimidazol reductase NimA-like FMN-containing flavoprotein (pyridoxamine 5'-phosphate oxidase superfamily)
MASDDIDDLLETQGYGILSLCGDGEPYSIPVSFGYDGERLYFGFLKQGADSAKVAHISDGATVRLLITDIRGRFEWQSVAVTGPVNRVHEEDDDWERFIETLTDNGWFMEAFERSDAVDSLQGWELDIDELQGLEQHEETYE